MLVQAISRDILVYAMRILANYFIVDYVHDELIIKSKPDVSLQTICDLMGKTPTRIPRLLLRADGYETMFLLRKIKNRQRLP